MDDEEDERRGGSQTEVKKVVSTDDSSCCSRKAVAVSGSDGGCGGGGSGGRGRGRGSGGGGGVLVVADGSKKDWWFLASRLPKQNQNNTPAGVEGAGNKQRADFQVTSKARVRAAPANMLVGRRLGRRPMGLDIYE